MSDSVTPNLPDRVSPVRIQQRLTLMLVLPLLLVGMLNAWLDYRSADLSANRQDQQLLRMLPLLADSIMAVGARSGDPPVLLLAAPVEEFLKERKGMVTYKIYTPKRRLLHGDAKLPAVIPLGQEPELFNQQVEGKNYRIAVQRTPSVAGDVIVMVADASEPPQWWKQVLLKVVLPNLVLLAGAVVVIGWVVQRGLSPLRQLIRAIQRRSPRDLSPINERGIPEEIRPLVQALNRLFGRVNDQAETQQRFIADAAHQLRTPIASLQVQIEAWGESVRNQQKVVAKGQQPVVAANDVRLMPARAEDGATMVQLPLDELLRLRAATRRTSQLVHQLLSLSRVDSDADNSAESQHFEVLDLKDVCESLLERHWELADSKQIDLGLEGDSVKVKAHSLLLSECMANLLVNAIKYTPAGGVVTLRCGVLPAVDKHQTPRAFIGVEDNGPGIPAAEREHVFERFYRLPNTKGEGTGLGLPIAQEVAQRHRSELVLADGVLHDDGQGCGLRATFIFAADLLVAA